MDINKYLQRIHYSGTITPTIETLNALQKTHLLHVPFENLDIHYGKKIILDTNTIFEKVMNNGRGGFCYELNGIFFELLQSMGFHVKMVSARVYNKEKQEFGSEYDHLAIVVNIDGIDYLSDVGFGEFTFHPLKIELNTQQRDPRGIFTIRQYDDTYLQVSKQSGEKWDPEYIFSPIARSFTEFEQMCIYHQISVNSHFTRNRLCSRPTPNGRITVTGDRIKITEGEEQTEQKINTEVEFRDLLLKYFTIQLNSTVKSWQAG